MVWSPKWQPKLRVPRAFATDVACSRAMTDTFERLKSALADRYRIEREFGSEW